MGVGLDGAVSVHGPFLVGLQSRANRKATRPARGHACGIQASCYCTSPVTGPWRPDGDRSLTKIQIELPDATAKAARDDPGSRS